MNTPSTALDASHRMQLHCFDPHEVRMNLDVSSPKGWEEFGICNACFCDGPTTGAYVATLSEFIESLGYKRDHQTRYEDIKGIDQVRDSSFRLFQKRQSPNAATYFVIARSSQRSSPDVYVSLLVAGALGWFAARRVRREVQVARQSLPSGWLQPFLSSVERESAFEGDSDFDELRQVSRNLQGYLYSAGAGVLPDSLDSIFMYGWKPTNLECYRLIEKGPTRQIWGDRPVLECTKPIKGVRFGCSAANQILPLRKDTVDAYLIDPDGNNIEAGIRQ